MPEPDDAADPADRATALAQAHARPAAGSGSGAKNGVET